jgi:hypothetical protein
MGSVEWANLAEDAGELRAIVNTVIKFMVH